MLASFVLDTDILKHLPYTERVPQIPVGSRPTKDMGDILFSL